MLTRPPHLIAPGPARWSGPFQITSYDSDRSLVSLSAFTTVPDRVSITCHEQYVSRLSSGFRGDVDELKSEADVEYPDNEIDKLCSHLYDDDGNLNIEVSWYQCGPEFNKWYKIVDRNSPLFEDAPDLVIAYISKIASSDPKAAQLLQRLVP